MPASLWYLSADVTEPSRIFISYARKDGALLAQRLQSDLTKEGFDAWLDTQRIAGGAVSGRTVVGSVSATGCSLATSAWQIAHVARCSR